MARTARQRAALKKAQAASARKRRGRGKGKLAAANRRHAKLKRNVRRAVVAGAIVGLAGTKTGRKAVVAGGYYGLTVGSYAQLGGIKAQNKYLKGKKRYYQARTNHIVTKKFKKQLEAM